MKNNQTIGETYRLENGHNNDEHELFHEYLLISPSYQLAHRVMTGKMWIPLLLMASANGI